MAKTSARVHAPAKDVDLLHVPVDETYRDGDELPGGLVAIGVPSSKTRGEHALLLPHDGGTLILGDSLVGGPDGKLVMLPDEKFANPDKARQIKHLFACCMNKSHGSVMWRTVERDLKDSDQRDDGQDRIVDLESDGTLHDLLYVPGGGSRSCHPSSTALA